MSIFGVRDRLYHCYAFESNRARPQNRARKRGKESLSTNANTRDSRDSCTPNVKSLSTSIFYAVLAWGIIPCTREEARTTLLGAPVSPLSLSAERTGSLSPRISKPPQMCSEIRRAPSNWETPDARPVLRFIDYAGNRDESKLIIAA